MITEDQLEQLAIQRFQDTDWSYVNGTVIAPGRRGSGARGFREVVLKGRLAEVVHATGEKEDLPRASYYPAFGE